MPDREIRTKVTLPDGRKAIEVESVYIGSNETQAVFTYHDPLTKFRIDKKKFETDYWGKIEGLT